MKAPPFAYARAESVDDALALLAEAGDDGKVVAGGQSLLPLLAYRLARPTHLVDIDGLEELRCQEEDDPVEGARGALRLGALTRHAWIEAHSWTGARRLFGEAAGLIGHLPIRTRGTLGGSLAHADPAAELPVALLALDAMILLRSAAGTRSVAIGEFFTGPFTTVLEPGEIVAAVVLPRCGERSVGSFAEFAVRVGDFALASVAVSGELESGRFTRMRVALGGVDATPIRSAPAERILLGAAPAAGVFAEAAAAAAAGCDPVSDSTTSAAYRRTLVERLVADALARAVGADP